MTGQTLNGSTGARGFMRGPRQPTLRAYWVLNFSGLGWREYVCRRPGLATTSNPDAPSPETKPPQARFDREPHPASAAAFGAKKADPSPVDVASAPKGRILPSLVPDEPLLEDTRVSAANSEPPSRAPKRPAVRTLKGKDQTSRLPRNSRISSDESAPLAERLSTASRQTFSMQSDDGAGVSPRVAATAPSQVVGGLALSAKGRRQIMARYVFGDELKPGERWKRRLLTSR